MYARSTTVRGTPQGMDAGISYVRDKVQPAVQQMDGCVGLSMLAERETGRCIVTTSWADHEALQNSADGFVAMRRRAAEIMGGAADVAEWEIALMHRLHSAHHGASARVIWHDGDPADVDRMIDSFRMTVLPQLEELPGCCSVSVLLDRVSGRSVVTTTYDSPQDMVAARDRAMEMRAEFMQKLSRTITEVAEFELVVAHLQVPETV
jgi:quinol monooxygenase YgiN